MTGKQEAVFLVTFLFTHRKEREKERGGGQEKRIGNKHLKVFP